MPIEPITTTGLILEKYSENAFRVSLPNGKEIIGHPHKSLADRKEELSEQTRVTLEMTPYDFEKARISHILS